MQYKAHDNSMVYFKYIVNHDMNCPPHFWHDSYHSGNYNEWTLSTRHNFRVRNFSKAFYRKAGMEQFVSTALIDWQGWSVCVCAEGGRGGGGGVRCVGIVFAGGWEMKIFSTVFQNLGKNMVGKWYFQLCQELMKNRDLKS